MGLRGTNGNQTSRPSQTLRTLWRRSESGIFLYTACMLLATKKSVCAPLSITALEYATLIHRKTYLVLTEAEGQTYGEEFIGVHPQLDVLTSKRYNRNYVVRILENDRSNFWKNVHNISGL